MIYLETQKQGVVVGVTVETAIKKCYGLYARFATWDDILDDGVVGLVVQRNPKHDSWDVIDHVLRINSVPNDRVTIKVAAKIPSWL